MEELEGKLEELRRVREDTMELVQDRRVTMVQDREDTMVLVEDKENLLCTQCVRRFHSKAELAEHYARIHKDHLEAGVEQRARVVRKVNRHLCQECGKHFADGWTLRHHQRTVHLDSREHSCGHCSKSFLSHKDMTRHVRGVHLGQRIVFPGTRRQVDTEACTVTDITVMEREAEVRQVPNILKRSEGKASKAVVAPSLEPEEGSGGILVEVEDEQVQRSIEPPIFQLENLENLQFVLQEGSGEPQIIIPESGIRLTIPGEEQEGQVLHLVPGQDTGLPQPEGRAGSPVLDLVPGEATAMEQGNLFSSEEFSLPSHLALSPTALATHGEFIPVDEKVVTEVKFADDLVDHPKKFIYKKVHSSSSPHLVAVRDLAKATSSVEQFRCNSCTKCFISAAFLDKHMRQAHASETADLGFIRTMINGNLETLELSTDYGDLNDLDAINSINIDVDAGSSHDHVGHLKTENDNLVLGSEDAFHEPIREVACKVCQKLFPNKLALSKHRKSAHKKQQKHRCEDCGSEFTSKQTLRAHMSSIHEGIKKVCSICLRPVADLVRHVRSQHRNVKKKEYDCDVCNMQFRTNFALQRHKNTLHMKLKAWPCDMCEKTFGEKRDMQRHKNSVHFGIKKKHTRWTCPECNIVFKLRREYDDHKTTFHAALTEEQVVKFLNAELESKKQKFHISAHNM